MTLRRRRQVAAVLEATEGTLESFAASAARHLVYDPSVAHDVSMFERKPARNTLTPLKQIVGIRKGTLTFRVEARGSGTLGTAPQLGTLLKACGFRELTMISCAITGGSGNFIHGETVTSDNTDPGTGVIYRDTDATGSTLILAKISGTFADTDTLTGSTSAATATISGSPTDPYAISYWPDSSAGEGNSTSLSLASYEDGLQKVLFGARGNFNLVGVVGEPMFFDFSFTGVEGGVADVALLTGISFETTQPPVFKNADVDFDIVGGSTNAPCIANFAFNPNNVLADVMCANAAEGIDAVRITDRNPTGTIDPETVLVATRDDFNEWFNATLRLLDFEIGSTSGNIFEFLAHATQRTNVQDGDADGRALSNHDLVFVTEDENAEADAEIVLVFR